MKKLLLPLFALCVFVLPALGQKDVEAIISNARALHMSGNYAEAAAEMNKALALDPNNVRYLFDQSEYYQRAKNDAAALANIERALKLEPDKEDTVLEAVRRLRNVAGISDRCERAQAVVDAFLVNHPKSDKAYSWGFLNKTCLQDNAGALSDISKAIELNPSYAMYQSNRANLVARMGDTKAAEQQLKSLIETLEAKLTKTEDRNAQEQIKRDVGEALRQLALVYEHVGEKSLSIEALTQAMPYNRALYLRERALAYGRFAMYENAIADLNLAIADDDEKFAGMRKAHPEFVNMELYSDRANIYYNAGEYQKALTDLRECLRLDPRNKSNYERRIERISQKIEKPN